MQVLRYVSPTLKPPGSDLLFRPGRYRALCKTAVEGKWGGGDGRAGELSCPQGYLTYVTNNRVRSSVPSSPDAQTAVQTLLSCVLQLVRGGAGSLILVTPGPALPPTAGGN